MVKKPSKCQTYRQLPVLSVSPGYSARQGVNQARKDKTLGPYLPSWLDGENERSDGFNTTGDDFVLEGFGMRGYIGNAVIGKVTHPAVFKALGKGLKPAQQ